MATFKRDRIIAVDVGTTGLRAGVVRADLQIEAVAIQSYPPVSCTQPCGTDPAHWWQALCRALSELTGKILTFQNRRRAWSFPRNFAVSLQLMKRDHRCVPA
jgi:sugar (pentulose or hexulose) kinase